MLRNGRAATSVILVGLLIFQTACLRSTGPPVPLRAEDLRQIRAVRRADRVIVWTVDHQQYELNNPSVAGQRLEGEWWGEEVVPIPVDSVAAIQLFNRRGREFGLFMLGVAVGAGGLLGWLVYVWDNY